MKPDNVVEAYRKSPETQNITNGEDVSETVRESWYTYSSSTTLHCICHLGNREYPIGRRAFWIFLFLGLAIGFVYQVQILITRYFEYSTVIKEVTIYENEPEFPTITICNVNKVFNDSVTDPEVRTLLLNTYMSNSYDMNYFMSLNETFLNSVNLTQIVVTNYWIEHTAVYCLWKKKTVPCKKYFRTVITTFGVCLAFNSREYIRDHGGSLRSTRVGAADNLVVALMTYQELYFIGDSAAAGFKVDIHHPNVEPGPGEDGVIVSPGTAAYIGIHKTETVYKPYPVKAFGDISCTDIKSSDFKNYLKYYDQYSVQGCMVECETEYVVKTCGCKDVLQPGPFRTCNAYECVICVTDARANFSVHGMQLCSCVLPCHFTHYNLQMSNAWYPSENFVKTLTETKGFPPEYLRKNLVELRIFYKSKLYTQQTQVLEITENDVYGALGGYMGLCFGASLGTLLELFEFFMNMCINVFKNKRFSKHHANNMQK